MSQPRGERISRRRFVALGAAALTAMAAGSLAYVERAFSASRRLGPHLAWARGAHLDFAERIEQHFDYLELDAEGVRAFAREYAHQRGDVGRFRQPHDDVFERYLLSTDFFLNGADESLPVRYVLFYDPYVNPCWHPCAPPQG